MALPLPGMHTPPLPALPQRAVTSNSLDGFRLPPPTRLYADYLQLRSHFARSDAVDRRFRIEQGDDLPLIDQAPPHQHLQALYLAPKLPPDAAFV